MLRTSQKPSESIPTSSMADVAFLLLVFFLVTTVFPEDRGLALVLPDGTAEVQPDNVLHLFVESEEAVSVRQGTSPQTRRVATADIGALWRSSVQSRPGLIAAVKTGVDVPYGAMVDVLDQLQGAGATRISLQPLPN